MKIEITREELQLIREGLDCLKRENVTLIKNCEDVGWTGIIERLVKENEILNKLCEKLADIVYGSYEK